MDGFMGQLGEAGRGLKRNYGTSIGNDPVRLFDARSYGNPRTEFASGSRGRSDAQPPGIGADVLDMGFNFGSVPPNDYAPIFAERELSANPRIVPYGRQYDSMANMIGGQMLGTHAPGRHHLAAVMRRPIPGSYRNVSLHFTTPMEVPTLAMADAAPMPAAAPNVLNAVTGLMQRELCAKDVDAYLDMTPTEFWNGPLIGPGLDAVIGAATAAKLREYPNPIAQHLMPNFAGFSWDGIVAQEEAFEGASTSMHNGRRTMPGVGGVLSELAPGDAQARKLVTVTAKGQQIGFDYCNRCGVHEGAYVFAVLRKFPRAFGESLTYSLVQKYDDIDASTNDTQSHEREFTIDDEAVNRRLVDHGLANATQFMPLEWGFVAWGDRVLPREYTDYVDEKGRTRHDALVVPVAQVLHAPLGGPAKPSVAASHFRGLRSVRKALASPMMAMIVNLDSTGLVYM
jgi:hypothetical protein